MEIAEAVEAIRFTCKGKGEPIYMVRHAGGKMLYSRITAKQVTYAIQSAAEALRNSDD